MNEVIAPLFARLNSQLSVPVYDHVPQDTNSYPYVVMRITETNNEDTDTEVGFSVILRVTAYSQYRGFAELMPIADSITNALNNWDMANTASFKVGTFKEQFRQFIVDNDELTRYSVQEYIFYYEPLL